MNPLIIVVFECTICGKRVKETTRSFRNDFEFPWPDNWVSENSPRTQTEEWYCPECFKEINVDGVWMAHGK